MWHWRAEGVKEMGALRDELIHRGYRVAPAGSHCSSFSGQTKSAPAGRERRTGAAREEELEGNITVTRGGVYRRITHRNPIVSYLCEYDVTGA